MINGGSTIVDVGLSEEMAASLIQDLEAAFPGRPLLTLEEICQFLGCETEVVYNWNKRSNPKRRPPCLTVGRQLRFQKRLLAHWLAREQEMKGQSRKGGDE
jgi:hypothetical protein